MGHGTLFFWGGDQTLQMYGHFEGFPKFFSAWGLGWRHISWSLLQGRHTKSFFNTPRKSQGKACLPPSFKGELLVFGGVFVNVGIYRYMLLMYFVLGCHWANNGGFEEIHWDSQPSPYHETGIYNLHDIVDSYGITVGQYTIRPMDAYWDLYSDPEGTSVHAGSLCRIGMSEELRNSLWVVISPSYQELGYTGVYHQSSIY